MIDWLVAGTKLIVCGIVGRLVVKYMVVSVQGGRRLEPGIWLGHGVVAVVVRSDGTVCGFRR